MDLYDPDRARGPLSVRRGTGRARRIELGRDRSPTSSRG